MGCVHFHVYLYGQDVLVYIDHSAVQAVLETPSSNGKYSRWWSKFYETGLKSIKIVYRSGQDNKHADVLSCSPLTQPTTTDDNDSVCAARVVAIQSQNEELIEKSLQAEPLAVSNSTNWAAEQFKDWMCTSSSNI